MKSEETIALRNKYAGIAEWDAEISAEVFCVEPNSENSSPLGYICETSEEKDKDTPKIAGTKKQDAAIMVYVCMDKSPARSLTKEKEDIKSLAAERRAFCKLAPVL